ncbi:hypothetical protein QWY86_00380 [Pedobacter aquatilis]|uniref:hypothetical protein n=1 Tax=Pedobacter aquatilis TaxID=351343 RepID=UPI0025B32C38|nr:hypothetical protein [Pedobacter aquatilis]MDN3585105.1 hypothetical protein [Pedobacter aquatilis]
MAGLVLNSTTVLRLNFCAKPNFCASISATSPSCQTLAVIVPNDTNRQEIIDQMESTFRFGTRKAKEELANELNLPFENWMQDWPYEVVIPDDIEKYIEHYVKLTDEDKKFVLMEGIIQATEDQVREVQFLKYWNEIKYLLDNDFYIHEYTIYYWSCFDNENIDDCWRITPFMRQFWKEKVS